MLVQNIKHKNVVEYINKETGEIEQTTYVFDINKAQRPIKFIEGYF